MLLGWNQISFLASIQRAFLNQQLSSSQKHTLIKMLKKKKTKAKDLLQSGGRYHCLIQIWEL